MVAFTLHHERLPIHTTIYSNFLTSPSCTPPCRLQSGQRQSLASAHLPTRFRIHPEPSIPHLSSHPSIFIRTTRTLMHFHDNLVAKQVSVIPTIPLSLSPPQSRRLRPQLQRMRQRVMSRVKYTRRVASASLHPICVSRPVPPTRAASSLRSTNPNLFAQMR